jgi:hypothetical protein
MRIAALLAALLLAPVLAFAAMPDAPATDPQGSVETLDPPADDGELSRFVDTLVSLVGLRHGAMMRLHAEPDPSKQAEIKTEAFSAMTSTVEEHGLTVGRYNEIATALQSDPSLQDRIGSLMQQLSEAAPTEQPPTDQE